MEWGKNHREKKIQIQSYYSVFSIIFKYQSSVQYTFSKLISKRSLCSIITAVQPVEFLTALILPIRWWQEQPLTAKQICFYCYSANTFGNDSKCLICFCKYDPLLVFCFRVSLLWSVGTTTKAEVGRAKGLPSQSEVLGPMSSKHLIFLSRNCFCRMEIITMAVLQPRVSEKLSGLPWST